MATKTTISFLLVLLLSIMSSNAQSKKNYALVIHGGAGTILKKNMTNEREKEYRDKLNEVLEAGEKVLAEGGTSLEAVVTAIKIMENSPLFNAGKGAVFTHDGKNELDASIMDGSNLNAGAVAGITTVRNPITAALAVMVNSEHVMLSGKGAEAFAADQELEIVEPSYFFTERRKKSLERAIKREQEGQGYYLDPQEIKNFKYGTVGCVALDQYGNIAAGTSTGGMTNKKWGRIGDAPIIGSGTYANNETCGVSATGHGEYFIRAQVAHDISARMEYKGIPLQEAADEVVMKKLVEMGGSGGIIALDAKGNISMTFNSEGMYRGFVKSDGSKKVMIYKDEE
ncbi:isoaspartyl peptidase/L-asparaginase [Flammeovirgaceae bacterium SG7u.111]|nr:isoaspartyl peptidase/L-asparaginase [Flammeovirgaceae bacterium SG7u.132]WPO38799.1 isoaspartyl peptidase/L-asparaginase [Flammeovirgaceae bacterium SG7u.111]